MSFIVPTIINPDPIVIPAEPEKTYPDQWVYSFSLTVPTVSSGRSRMELLPFNESEFEILGGVSAEVISVPWEIALSAIPAAQQIFDLLYTSASSFRTLAASLSGA